MSELLSFAPEPEQKAVRERAPWKLLIVDDEQEVHAVTTLALGDFSFAGRSVEFLHCHSGAEARELLAREKDVAVILLDVVMESEQAGLEVVEYVRNELDNRFIRIVLRTGQPGQAPEIEVISRYDINGYTHKAELTREKLFSVVHTALSTFRDLRALDTHRRGLEKIVESTASLFELESISRFSEGVLEQLIALLFVDSDAVLVGADGVAAESVETDQSLTVIAATGSFASSVGKRAGEGLPDSVIERIENARGSSGLIYGEDFIIGHEPSERELVFYISTDQLDGNADKKLLELFYRNVSIAYKTICRLNEDAGSRRSSA